jgi:integrase
VGEATQCRPVRGHQAADGREARGRADDHRVGRDDPQGAAGRAQGTRDFRGGHGDASGRVLGLTVDRLDMLRREVHVDRQLVTLAGHSPHLGPPKTKSSVRTIPLPQVVVDELAAHLARFPAADGLVFTLEGLTLTRSMFGHLWRAAARSAGLASGTGMHALRHYYASLLIRFGESVKTVQMRLGHATAAETLDTYSHLWPDSDDRTRDAIDSVLGDRADSLRTGMTKRSVVSAGQVSSGGRADL